MARCSRSYCSAEALPGKSPRLCAEHHADRKRRQDAHRALPECEAPGCKQRTKNGICPTCRRESEELLEQQNEKDRIRRELRSCETVADLIEFIEYRLMED